MAEENDPVLPRMSEINSAGSSTEVIPRSASHQQQMAVFLGNWLDGYGRSGRSGMPDSAVFNRLCSLVLGVTILFPVGLFVWQIAAHDTELKKAIEDNVSNLMVSFGAIFMAAAFIWDLQKPVHLSGMVDFKTQEFFRASMSIWATEPVCIVLRQLLKIMTLLASAIAFTIASNVDSDMIQYKSTFKLSWNYAVAYPLFVLLWLLSLLLHHVNKCRTVLTAQNMDIVLHMGNAEDPISWGQVRKRYLNAKYLFTMFNDSLSFVFSVGITMLVVLFVRTLRIFTLACHEESWEFVGLSFAVGIGLILGVNMLLLDTAKVSAESVRTPQLISELALAQRVPRYQDNTKDKFDLLKEKDMYDPFAVKFFNSLPISTSFIVIFDLGLLLFGAVFYYLVLLNTK